MTTINVKRITSKEVNTRFGNKPVYSVQGADGTWYKCGFKKPTFKEGDTIEADLKETSYGPEITSSTVSSASSGEKAVVSRTPAPAMGGKVFPVPALHGDRSIIRQNSLTNAREAWVAGHGGKVFSVTEEDAMSIIAIARVFESYSCGDIDMAMAKVLAANEGVDVDDII